MLPFNILKSLVVAVLPQTFYEVLTSRCKSSMVNGDRPVKPFKLLSRFVVGLNNKPAIQAPVAGMEPPSLAPSSCPPADAE